MLKKIATLLVLAGAVSIPGLAQAPAAPAKTPAPSKPAAPSQVDNVIQLLKGGMSESLIIKTLQRENKPVNLTTADLLKLNKAGVSENIISVLSDPSGAAAPAAAPKTAGSSPAPPAAPAAVAATGAATPFPAAFGAAAAGPRKRRLAVKPFDYSTVRTWVNYWFHNDVNIGDGIRAMLTARMAQSRNITLLERAKVDDALKEQDFGATNRVAQGTRARIGKVVGADAILYGDITIFGRDDTKKGGNIASNIPGPFGRLGAVHKEDKAVVAIALRIVDAETLEVIETGEARGESKRTSNDWGALMAGNGKFAAVNADMTSSNFENTIIGEATSDAVTKVVAFLDERIPKMPQKARSIEGLVAVTDGASMTLAIGGNEGIVVGDRFEISRITGTVVDPETKEVIDKQTVKVGEFVVHSVKDKTATGEYGGQPVSQSYITPGKGYSATLMQQ